MFRDTGMWAEILAPPGQVNLPCISSELPATAQAGWQDSGINRNHALSYDGFMRLSSWSQNTWSPVCGSVRACLGHVTLLEEICRWRKYVAGGNMSQEAGFEVSKPHTISSSFSLFHACSSRLNPRLLCPPSATSAGSGNQSRLFFLLVSLVLMFYTAAVK